MRYPHCARLLRRLALPKRWQHDEGARRLEPSSFFAKAAASQISPTEQILSSTTQPDLT